MLCAIKCSINRRTGFPFYLFLDGVIHAELQSAVTTDVSYDIQTPRVLFRYNKKF
jgi:hypothetical protein